MSPLDILPPTALCYLLSLTFFVYFYIVQINKYKTEVK